MHFDLEDRAIARQYLGNVKILGIWRSGPVPVFILDPSVKIEISFPVMTESVAQSSLLHMYTLKVQL